MILNNKKIIQPKKTKKTKIFVFLQAEASDLTDFKLSHHKSI